MKKIIFSFTTIPSRIEYIEPVIQSVILQSLPPDEIHLQIAEFSLKNEIPYIIPEFLKKYESLKIIKNSDDVGSATKWFYPLQYLKNTSCFLIIGDDDCEYSSSAFEKLIDNIGENTNFCFCYTGGILPRKPQKLKYFKVNNKPQDDSLTIIKNNSEALEIDTVQGFSLFVIQPEWFNEFNFKRLKGQDLRNLSDDIVLSGLLEFLNIKRVQLAPYTLPNVLAHSELNPIHGEGRLTEMTKRAVKYMQFNFNIWIDVKTVSKGIKETFKFHLKRLIKKIR